MFTYSSDRPEDANAELATFFVPVNAIDLLLPVISAAHEWNAKIFGAWFDLAIRRFMPTSSRMP
jgi:hypothetical protein